MQIAYINIDLVKVGITEALGVAKARYKTLKGRLHNGIFKSRSLYKETVETFDYEYSMSFMLTLITLFEPDKHKLIELHDFCVENKLFYTAGTIATELDCREERFDEGRMKRLESLSAYLWFLKARGVQNVPSVIISSKDSTVGVMGENVKKFLFLKTSEIV